LTLLTILTVQHTKDKIPSKRLIDYANEGIELRLKEAGYFMNEITEKNIRYGLTFKESKPDVYITDFSATAWRRAYIKALFFENEKWIKCIEAKENGRIINSIVDCKDKHRTDRNLELQADLKDQVYNNLEYRKGYYKAWKAGKPTTKFNKYLHPDVRRFIQKYERYKNATEISNGDREICVRDVCGEVDRHEQRTDRSVTEPKRITIRETLPEEAIILR